MLNKLIEVVKWIYWVDLLEEIEEVYGNCERKIDVKEVIEWWDGRVIMDLEYLYYVMKGENDKFAAAAAGADWFSVPGMGLSMVS